MTQQEMEAQALIAAVDILYCMYDREEPNYTTDKIATLMSEAYKAGKAEQKQIDIEKAVRWLDDNINKYLFNDNSNGKYRDWLKCSSQAFVDFRKAMEE